MEAVKLIRELAEGFLTDKNLFVVDVVLSVKREPKKILVVLDGDKGVTIDDCADLSRQLNTHLDDQAIIDGNYRLEVSSPGLDQPLKLTRQYVKNIGRKLRVKTTDRTLEGKLLEVDEDGIVVGEEEGKGKQKTEKPVRLSFKEIEKALVMVSFN